MRQKSTTIMKQDAWRPCRRQFGLLRLGGADLDDCL
jgi:hypothetical protein